MNRSRAICALAALLGGVLGVSAGPDIVREGTGERRASLDERELTAFDQSLWSHLTDWTNGEALNAASTDGKVVLIYTWSGYLPTAVRPLSVVNRLADRYGERGLVVVGVHNDQGWEEGIEIAEKRRASFPIARDTGNAFRKAMLVDQDPDFYVIDRSGRLRYADIETASLERAVSTLIEESVTDAETLIERMASSEAEAAVSARRSMRLRSQIDLTRLPWVDFPEPGEEAYAQAEWPKQDTGDNNSRRRSRRGAPTGPVKVDLNSDLTWHPRLPEHTEGRAMLIYLYPPDIVSMAARGGYNSVQLFQMMDQIQAAHSRDLLVVGAMIRNEENSRRSSRRRGNDDQDAEKAKDATEQFEIITSELPVNHARVFDLGGRLITSRISPNNGEIQGRRGGRNAGFALPYHILVSSDGVVRWHGSISTSNERLSEWEAALAAMLREDPGIKARHEAEGAYIKSITD